MLLNDLLRKQQKTNKTTKVNYMLVRVRVELTTLALSAPRSAD